MMYNKEDWNAAISSEIFREYLKGEMCKHTIKEPKCKLNINSEQIFKEIEKFEEKVLANPQIKQAFQALQHKFETDPEYTAKVDPTFVQGVMMLNLSN